MADQIIIRGENPETTNIFEESPQIVNVIETNDSEVRIYEQGSESTNLTDENIFVNVFENEDVVVRIFEPGIRGATGATGTGGSGSTSIPDGTISGSSQVIYSQINGIPINLFSSSQQVNFSQISGSFSTSSFLQNLFTASFNSFSSSIETRVFRIESVTSSFAIKTEVSGAFTSISASLSGRIGAIEGETLISGSEQLTSSYDSRYERKGSGILSSSNGFLSSSEQVNYNLIQNQPTTILSASYALTASYVSGSNSISSSYAETASFATNIQTIGIRIKTDDTYITEGSKGYKHIGYNSNIIKLRSIANIAGNININVKRDGLLLGNYQLSNQSSSLDTTLTNWTSSLNTNDLIEFYVSQSSTYITDITFFMDLQNR